MNKSTSDTISLHFIGLPAADQATFQRVISFCRAKGQHFEVVQSSDADVLICEDSSESLEAAKSQQTDHLLLVVSHDKACQAGDIQLQRPLLVTRVMRTMEVVSQRCQNNVRNPSQTLSQTALKEDSLTEKSDQSKTEGSLTEKADQATAEASPELNTIPPKPKPAPPTQSYLALVIDDSATIRKQLEIELRTSNMHSEFAESGEEALQKIESTEYDLIFLDIMMPGIDGYETCDRIRKDARYKKTPVIMLSGKTSPLDEVKGVLAGASTYLTKPIKHAQFQEVIQRITRWLDEFR